METSPVSKEWKLWRILLGVTLPLYILDQWSRM
jgi:hypothetical protein